MRSLKFPKMFKGNAMEVWKPTEHLEATKQNLKLLLNSFRNELLGDPYFGITNMLFDQNSAILQNALADMIYTQIALFMPQIRVRRQDVQVFKDPGNKMGKLICSVSGINQIDFELNTFSLTLFEESDFVGA